MVLSTRYNPQPVEEKWYSFWMNKGFFRSVPDSREPYTIVIPPPNVTGVLHMGHVLNNTIQDVLVRRARMLGKNACWVPGTDHASIATEAKVVGMLREQGIRKCDLSREEFLKYAWEWKEKYGGIILEQLKKLGCSCDWSRTRFTMDKELSDSVEKVFIDLFNKGYIYRGHRMINWDPVAKTALSDEEVIHREVNSKLYYVKYLIVDELTRNLSAKGGSASGGQPATGNFITIATTRPETILGDTGVCVNPKDPRYQNLKGKFALIPFVNRVVPILFDDYVDMEFGTGALKVTPAHDLADYDLGKKHNLEVIDIISEDGALNEKAGFYFGMDRFAARKKIVEDLEKEGLIEKVETIRNKIGYSERTDAVIEPRLSLQWFLKMDSLSKSALENVLNGEIKLIPERFFNTYRNWLENVRDWCISRQLWWGHRIPVWYCDGKECKDVLIVQSAKPEHCPRCNCKNELRQEEDVLDTWFSSWLWPLTVFNGINEPDNSEIKYYYPTNDLVTAPEILFFWVARMIISGYEYMSEKPFGNVYLTGTVRDKQGRKMSKSLGNSPEPLDLIVKYGADGVRVGMLLCSPAGNDLLFDECLCEQGRNFCNKIWNAFRLVKSWKVANTGGVSKESEMAVKWFHAKLYKSIGEINDHFSKFRISDALMALYKLVWDDFCSLYLEIIKPDKDKEIHLLAYEKTIGFFEELLKLLHPFTPFITEELWQQVRDRGEDTSIINSPWPTVLPYDELMIGKFEYVIELISSIRSLKSEKNIPFSQKPELFIPALKSEILEFREVIKKIGGLSEVTSADEKPAGCYTFLVRSGEYHIKLPVQINTDGEKAKLRKELDYVHNFLNSVLRKLDNTKFIEHASHDVLEKEKKKKADSEIKIKLLEEQIAAL